MAAFFYEHSQSYLYLDPSHPCSSPSFPSHYSPSDERSRESCTSFDSGTTGVINKSMASVSIAPPNHSGQATTSNTSMEKKRKESKGGKSRKQKKRLNEEEDGAVEEQKPSQEPPCGYIHVRARRGQATDSHSLAERVRREKINERMKMLQGLVPGCDKVTGKAIMLDEIINYVQSLQHQVEFLSMKLASAQPMQYDPDMSLDAYMVQNMKLENMSPPPVPSLQLTSHVQPTAFAETDNNYPMLDTSLPFLLHVDGPTTAFSQDDASFVMQVDGHSQGVLDQLQFDGMSPHL